MSRYQLAACLIVGCSAFISTETRAQNNFGADVLYSSGVEAYFRGCSAEAESDFSSLLGVDPNDPRAFYFRALSLMRQGREDEARADMELGAQVEARLPNRFDIGKTLERVQGPTRLLLEHYRNNARTAAATNAPIGAVRAPDTAVLRERRIVPLDEFSRPGDPQSIPAPPEPVEPTKASPPAAKPSTNAAPANPNDPFSDDAGAAPKPQPKAPPAKAAAPQTPPPAAAPLPPAPKPAPPAPKPADDDKGNPFL